MHESQHSRKKGEEQLEKLHASQLVSTLNPANDSVMKRNKERRGNGKR
jgi:hypothetical protein